jgi:hypothetical protein
VRRNVNDRRRRVLPVQQPGMMPPRPIPDCSLDLLDPSGNHRPDIDAVTRAGVEDAYRRGLSQGLWLAQELADELARRKPAACGPGAGALLRLAYEIAQEWRYDGFCHPRLVHEVRAAVHKRKRWRAAR